MLKRIEFFAVGFIVSAVVVASSGCGWLARGLAPRTAAQSAARQGFIRSVETAETLATGATIGFGAAEFAEAVENGSAIHHQSVCD